MRNFSIMSLFLFIGTVFSSTVYVTDDSTYALTLVPTLPVGTTVLYSDHTDDGHLIQGALCESIGHVVDVGCGNFGDNPIPTEQGTVQFWLDPVGGDGTGVYEMHDNVYVYSDTTLRGYVNNDELATTLRVPDNECNGGGRSGVLIMEGQNHVVVESLRLDGNKCNQHCNNGYGDTGLYIRYCTDVEMSEMEIVQFTKHGVHFRDSSVLTFNFGTQDPYSRVDDNVEYGFMLENSDTVVLDNPQKALTSTGEVGLRIKRTNDVLLRSTNCVINDLFGNFDQEKVRLTDSFNFRCDVN